MCNCLYCMRTLAHIRVIACQAQRAAYCVHLYWFIGLAELLQCLASSKQKAGNQQNATWQGELFSLPHFCTMWCNESDYKSESFSYNTDRNWYSFANSWVDKSV